MSVPTSPSIKGVGPIPARIAIVTASATADDLWKGYPLAGHAGDFFAKMLHEAGITLTSCYRTTVLKHRAKYDRPDDLFTQNKAEASREGLTTVLFSTYIKPELVEIRQQLIDELSLVQPTVIVALGDLAMWSLTGVYGSVDTWRGSQLEPNFPTPWGTVTVIPTYDPAWIMKMYHVRSFTVRDLRRAHDVAERPEAYHWPAYKFEIRPSFHQVMGILHNLLDHAANGPLPLACDIETIARQISCIGIAWNVREALCIPFLTLDGTYWNEDEEITIMGMLRFLLTHHNVEVIGQNFNYDNQHFAKHLGFLPNLIFDTMIAQHVLFPGIPKSLDFLSSLYCHFHRYWKDEMDDYSRLPENMEQYWTYNCKDCVTTFEVSLVLKELLSHLERWPQYDFMFEVSKSALESMLRGMRIDQQKRSEVAAHLLEAIAEYEGLINRIVGEPLNVASPKQMTELFYNKLKLPIQKDRRTRRPTCSSPALQKIAEKEPLIKPLVDLIEKKRSLGVFLSTFCMMPLDSDGRMRCSFNVCGTETMRFSSSSNAFGTGGNLQNIPSGEEE
jgi:uracil-DNA glycosylase